VRHYPQRPTLKETTMTNLSRLTLPALALAMCSTALLAGGVARADDTVNAMKPAVNAMKPATDAMKPAANAMKPTTDAMKPADPMASNAMKPATDAMKPATDTN
jgi:hypothetical protein